MSRRIKLKPTKNFVSTQWNLYAAMEDILVEATKPEFLNRMLDDILENKITPLIRATQAIEQRRSFAQDILANYENCDSICTSLGFCGLAVSIVEIPNMQELVNTTVAGLIYVDNTNVYICLNASTDMKVRNFARITLLAYLQLNFSTVICSTGVAPVFMLLKNGATRMLITRVMSEEEYDQLFWLTNYILLKHLACMSKGRWLHLYAEKDIILCCDSCSEKESSMSKLLCTADECDLFIKSDTLNLADVSSLQTYYNSLIHVIDSGNLSMSKVEFGYPIDKSQNLSNILCSSCTENADMPDDCANFYETLMNVGNRYGSNTNFRLGMLITALVEAPKSAVDLEELVFSTMRVQGNMGLEEFISVLLNAVMLEYNINGIGVLSAEAYMSLLNSIDNMRQS